MASRVVLSAIAIALLCTLLATAAAEERPHSLAKRFFGYHRSKVYVVNSHPIVPVVPAYHPVYPSNPGYPSYAAPPSQVVLVRKHHLHHHHRPGVSVHFGRR